MDKPKESLAYLFTRYYEKTATEVELEQFFEMLDTLSNDEIGELLKNPWEKLKGDTEIINADKGEDIRKSIITIGKRNNIKKLPQKHIIWWRFTAAASIFLLLSFSAYFWLKPLSQSKHSATLPRSSHDITPGGNKALLRFSNGTTIMLDTAQNGMLARQGNIVVSKTKSGQLVFAVGTRDNNDPSTLGINTISTPLGGQYQVNLPDGTKAWLNSKSTLSFPSVFKDNERKVEMTGEVYFEVAKNAAMPFKVKFKNTVVEVLGTHFNIMAYDDEDAQRTTLLEGSVKILVNKETNILKPGQQAALDGEGLLKVYNGVDVEKVIAWKNGFFDFKKVDIESIMRQASRWYDIHVIYKGESSHTFYTGRISKDVNLSELLSMLQFTGLKYQVEGNNVTINQ